MTFYTGIGSRRAPPDVLDDITRIAGLLADAGLILRSGAARGCDTAFETGCKGKAHIYVPWRGFSKSPLIRSFQPAIDAYKIAMNLHPAWQSISRGAKALHARNCHQVLGDNLNQPSAFVICWTPDGCESESTRSKDTGGTATAICLAEKHGVPVYNLKNQASRDAVARLLDDLEL